MILQHTLLDQATVTEELHELARLEPLRIHWLSKATVVGEDALDDLLLIVFHDRYELLAAQLSFNYLRLLGLRGLLLDLALGWQLSRLDSTTIGVVGAVDLLLSIFKEVGLHLWCGRHLLVEGLFGCLDLLNDSSRG